MISYFLERAVQCRRLAAGIADDRTSEALIKLAEEFEAKAAAYVARGSANHEIGVGDDVLPLKKAPSKPKRHRNKKST